MLGYEKILLLSRAKFRGDYPSSSDVTAIQEIYRSSKNPGPGFLLAIVGTRPLEEGLSLSWCNDRLVPVALVEAVGSKA